MQIVFTICSNNYLAQAKTLGDSLLKYNSDIKFIIGLCDELYSEIDYSNFCDFEIIPFDKLPLTELGDMINKYSIVELNTSIKASFFKYLINLFPNCDKIYYLDPDIMVFSSIDILNGHLDENDVILTPHVLYPICLDDKMPSENLFMMYGIYNLGFIGVKSKSENTLKFLDWWEERLVYRGHSDINNGFYVDQLWINLAPVYFSKVSILKILGLNVAPWNLHERQIKMDSDGTFIMNDGLPLIFYHFSSYSFKKPQVLSNYFTRCTYENASEVVKSIYTLYHDKLIENSVERMSKIDYKFGKKPQPLPLRPSNFKRTVFLFIPPIFLTIYYHTKKFIMGNAF